MKGFLSENKKILSTAILGMVSALSLSAANAGAGSWEGFYAGGALGNQHVESTLTEYSGAWDYGEYSFSKSDGNHSIFLGYNHQIGQNGVIGAEVDFNSSSFDEERFFSCNSPGTDCDYYNKSAWDSSTTLRGRAGLTVNDAFIYASGGIAHVKTNYEFGEVGDPDVERSENDMGYTFGTGVEFAATKNILIRGEYLHLALDSEPYQSVNDDDPYELQSSGSIARVGAAYKF